MSLSRQEKEGLVLDLYKKGRSYREIAEYARISFRDIKTIVNKEALPAETKAEQLHPSITEVADYRLFSEGKDPVQVAIELNITQSDLIRFEIGYWKLKQLHHINQVYEQVNGNLLPFLELYELARKDGLNTEQVLKAVKIVTGKLPNIESRYKELQYQVEGLEYKTQTLQYEIISQKQVLESYNRCCIKQRQEIENLYNQKKQLEEAVAMFKFKNTNKDHAKIR
jgi:hypothetical protein